MTIRKNVDARAMGLMLLLSITWGLQQVALKMTAIDITPMMLIALRSGMSAVMVALLMLAKREKFSLTDGSLRPGLLVGFLFALEFLLIAEGLRHTSAAHMVVFLYTAPIFAALGLHRNLPAERLRRLQWLGIGLAFSGIAVAFFGHAQPVALNSSGDTRLGDMLGLAAGATWGATTVAVRCSSLSNASTSKTVLYQLTGAFVLLVPATFFLGQSHINPTPAVISNLALQAVIVSFASYMVWFWMLRHYLASQLGVFSFMTPLFGVAFGVYLLNEPIEPGFLGGSLLVLAGIVLVSGHVWLAQTAGTVYKRLRQTS